MASQPDVLQSCLQEAARAAKPALEHCIETAITALQAAETHSMKTSERDELASAWRGLLDNKAAWSARYQADLLAAFDKGIAAALAAGENGNTAFATSTAQGLRRTGSLGMDAFSLVDDADVTQAIESSRLLQHILPCVEQTLAELDTLISSAQGLANVRPELNPLRPEVFTQVLQGLMANAAADPPLVSTWVRHLADPMGRELKRIYEKLIRLLEQANVQAANYRVLQTPAGIAGKTRAGGGKAGSTPGGLPGGSGTGSGSGGEGAYAGGKPARPPSQYADLSNYEIRDELFQDFLFHGGSNAHHGLAPSYYATVDEELSALKAAPDSTAAPLSGPAAQDEASYQAVPAVDRPQRFVDVSSPLSAKVWGTYGRSRERAIVRTQLRKEATKVGQVLGLEVVRKLVNQVAQDPRLLVPVREAIVALEPSLLRLAMVDPRFFSDEGHPGRRLMERVAQRSFKYNDEFSPEFAVFFQAVTGSFNELNALAIEDAKPFGMALAALEHAWDAQDQREFETRHKVLQALHFAEERQERADQIAFDLSARSDLDNVPGVVLDFLFGPWSLAMAHAKLVDQRNQVDPEGFGSVVPDLLWSVKRDVTLKRPAKLIEMIPGLLDKLHSGLSMLGQAPRENEKFFESLMKLHQPVLKLRRLKSKRDAEESGAIPLEPEELPATPEQRRARVAEQPWLGRDDLDAAGFEDTLPTAPGELLDELPAAPPAARPLPAAVEAAAAAAPDTTAQAEGDNASRPAHTSPEAEAILLGLRTGSWVDLYSKRRWLRAQLIWASSKATLFMFLSHGGQPHSMTKRSCEKLIMQRWLRPVDTQAVVAQALDAVASEVAAQAPPLRQGSNAFLPSAAPQDEPATV
ncbi:DUF1631 family protein [Polaromonas sp.]|uniref:DUF1631 family protein n=1 Tax=Polaromonas sp. TaxID=1869339 RepID=UPI003BA8D3FD